MISQHSLNRKREAETRFMMNEGIAQWITFKKIRRPYENRTLTLFLQHAKKVPEEYRFYEKLLMQEKHQGLESVINTISCWRSAPNDYNWTAFVEKARKGTFELSESFP